LVVIASLAVETVDVGLELADGIVWPAWPHVEALDVGVEGRQPLVDVVTVVHGETLAAFQLLDVPGVVADPT
jgi:hypothetical protein